MNAVAISADPPDPRPGSVLAVIARAAADPSVDVEKMERLMQMHRDEVARQAAQAYSEALVSVQARMPTIHKDRLNTQTNSNYATLEAVNRVVTPIYTAAGLALSFGTEDSPLAEHVRIVCDVIHRDGHSRRYFYDAPMDGHGIGGKINKTPTHARGSAISYGRRYLTNLIFNLTTSNEDDDGNGAGAELSPEEQSAAEKAASMEQSWLDALNACTDQAELKARKAEMVKAYVNMVPQSLVAAYNARLRELKAG